MCETVPCFVVGILSVLSFIVLSLILYAIVSIAKEETDEYIDRRIIRKMNFHTDCYSHLSSVNVTEIVEKTFKLKRKGN